MEEFTRDTSPSVLAALISSPDSVSHNRSILSVIVSHVRIDVKHICVDFKLELSAGRSIKEVVRLLLVFTFIHIR